MRPRDQAAACFLALRALKSDDPSIRRPAIAMLIDLAQQATSCIRAGASAALAREFGPYAVSEGLSGCAAPISTVHQCDAEGWDCHACVWLWNPPPSSASDPASKNDVAAESIQGVVRARRLSETTNRFSSTQMKSGTATGIVGPFRCERHRALWASLGCEPEGCICL